MKKLALNSAPNGKFLEDSAGTGAREHSVQFYESDSFSLTG